MTKVNLSRLEAARAEAVIEVSDTGIGVKEEDKKHLFEPLFTKKKGDLRLGLYFVRMAVDARALEARGFKH